MEGSFHRIRGSGLIRNCIPFRRVDRNPSLRCEKLSSFKCPNRRIVTSSLKSTWCPSLCPPGTSFEGLTGRGWTGEVGNECHLVIVASWREIFEGKKGVWAVSSVKTAVACHT